MFNLTYQHEKFFLEKEKNLIKNLKVEENNYNNYKNNLYQPKKFDIGSKFSRNNKQDNAKDLGHINRSFNNILNDSYSNEKDNNFGKFEVASEKAYSPSKPFNKNKFMFSSHDNMQPKILNDIHNWNGNENGILKKNENIPNKLTIASKPIPKYKSRQAYQKDNKNIENEILLKKLFDEQNQILNEYKTSANKLIKERDEYINETNILKEKIIETKNNRVINNINIENYVHKVIEEKLDKIIKLQKNLIKVEEPKPKEDTIKNTNKFNSKLKNTYMTFNSDNPKENSLLKKATKNNEKSIQSESASNIYQSPVNHDDKVIPTLLSNNNNFTRTEIKSNTIVKSVKINKDDDDDKRAMLSKIKLKKISSKKLPIKQQNDSSMSISNNESISNNAVMKEINLSKKSLSKLQSIRVSSSQQIINYSNQSIKESNDQTEKSFNHESSRITQQNNNKDITIFNSLETREDKALNLNLRAESVSEKENDIKSTNTKLSMISAEINELKSNEKTYTKPKINVELKKAVMKPKKLIIPAPKKKNYIININENAVSNENNAVTASESNKDNIFNVSNNITMGEQTSIKEEESEIKLKNNYPKTPEITRPLPTTSDDYKEQLLNMLSGIKESNEKYQKTKLNLEKVKEVRKRSIMTSNRIEEENYEEGKKDKIKTDSKMNMNFNLKLLKEESQKSVSVERQESSNKTKLSNNEIAQKNLQLILKLNSKAAI